MQENLNDFFMCKLKKKKMRRKINRINEGFKYIWKNSEN